MLQSRHVVGPIVFGMLAACAPVRSPAPWPARVAGVASPLARESLFNAPWVWTDERGQRVSLSRWRGHELVVSAIYATCKSTCPRTIGKMEKIQAGLEREGRAAEFVLVTLDPETDTPADLQRFKQASHFPDNWHLLNGGLPDTRALAEVLEIHVLDDGPHLMHDARIVIFDREGHPVRGYGGYALDEETTYARR